MKRAPSIIDMVRGGLASLRDYRGLCLSLYLIQLAVAFGAGWVAARILTVALGRYPVFDRAVAGDLSALIFVLRDSRPLLVSVFWLGVGAVIAYAVLSWFLVGGLNAVLLGRPAGKLAVARRFGGGGAATFWAYARLAALSALPYAIGAVTVGVGLWLVRDSMKYALTGGDVLGALIPAVLPGAVILWLHATAVEYARIELSRQAARPGRDAAAAGDAADSSDAAPVRLRALRALLGGYRFIFTDRRPLAHALLHSGAFVTITALYMLGTSGATMAGAGGAIALFGIRQLVAALRFGNAVARAGGQVALARRDR